MSKLAVLMLDGIELKERTPIVCLGITTEGVKIPLGLWEGSTENATNATKHRRQLHSCRHNPHQILEPPPAKFHDERDNLPDQAGGCSSSSMPAVTRTGWNSKTSYSAAPAT